MSRFTFNFYNDIRKPLKSGLFSIKVNLYDAAEKRTINFTIKKVNGIEISCSKKDWQDIWVNKDKKNSFGEVTGETTVYGHKMTIRTILKAKEDILNDILNFEGTRSLESIKEDFNNYSLPTSYTDNVYKEFDRKITELRDAERYKSMETYVTTKNNIIKFNPPSKIFTFSDITVFWLDNYERSRSKLGIKKASIAIDMRNIRAIFNRVKKNDAYLIENYPFGADKNLYTIKEGRAKNQSLSKEDLKKVYKFSSNNTYLQLARDVFIFAYYGGGMNWKDLILLTQKDIENEYFVRSKTEFTTKEEVHIPLNLVDEQREIINRYKGEGKYLFSFLDEDSTALDIFNEQKNGISRINKQLKKLSKELKLDVGLSWNWSRHSFATHLHTAEGVSEKSIQEAMGHTDAKTTRTYMDSLHKKESESINKALDLSDDS